MDEVELETVKMRCGVYGEGTVFSVKIARDAKVSALQEGIFEKKRYRERYTFDASALTLYLAKKNGAWLADDDTLDALLGGDVDKQFVKMRPSWKLNKKELLGLDSSPERKRSMCWWNSQLSRLRFHSPTIPRGRTWRGLISTCHTYHVEIWSTSLRT